MSKRYENIIKKYAERSNKRVQRPKTLEDHVTNLGIDIKSMQLFLHGINVKNLKDMNPEKLAFKIDRAKMSGHQAIHNVRQMIKLLMEKKWVGDGLDFDEFEAEPIRYKPPKKLDVPEEYQPIEGVTIDRNKPEEKE